MILNNIISEIKRAKKIAILPHISADGDSLGSSIALGLALKKINKNIDIFLEEPIPYIYAFLPATEDTQVYFENVEHDFSDCDLTIALDTGSIDRLGKRVVILNSSSTTINIDHHMTNSNFADFNYVRTDASSVGEIIYELLKTMEIDIDEYIATCLYVSIASDTGGFRYSNTKPETHRIVAALIEKGVDVSYISQKMFETTSLGKVKLMARAINSLQLYEDGKVAFITITNQIIELEGAAEEDSDGLVNVGRNIQGVEVAAMLREYGEDSVKVNLRSNNYLDVSEIANLFSGGGHKKAAGCIIEGTLEEVKIKLLDKIKNALKS